MFGTIQMHMLVIYYNSLLHMLLSPSYCELLDASCDIVKLPNIIAIAAIQNTNTPKAILPPVATKYIITFKEYP